MNLMNKLLRRILPLALAALASCDSPTDASAGEREILFFRLVDGFTQIFAIRPDGTREVQLTHGEGNNRCARWSPDRKKISFLGDRLTTRAYEVYTMDPDGGNVFRVTRDAGFAACADWSPDGGRLVYSGANPATGRFNLYTIAPNGENRTLLAGHEWDDIEPRWSPDGRTILYLENRGILVNGTWNYGYRMRLVSPDGTGGRPLPSTCPSNIAGADWSPDGSWIVFNCESGASRTVRMIQSDGSNESTTLGGSLFHGFEPSWSPDGKRLLVGRTTSGNLDLFTVALDGTGAIQVTTDPASDVPTDWGGRP